MGNDGGSIPTRRELVKSAARVPTISELKATALESLGHRWSHCAVSDERLDLENAVSDWRGRLYNYESILKGLIPSQDPSPEAADREDKLAAAGISSLRDIVKLRFKKASPPGTSSREEIWACPISLKELGPATKAVYLVPCGHVFAEVAIKEIQDRQCPECSAELDPENVIPIFPREESELERLRQRLVNLKAKGLSHNLKKDKSGGKNKKRKADEGKENGVGSAQANGNREKKGSKEAKLSNINNAMAASLTAKVLAEQEERNKRRKLAAAR